MSIYPRVSRICTPRRSVHLRYPCISVHPPSLINDVLGGRDRASWDIHLVAEIEWTQWYTPRLWSSEFGLALGGRDRVNSVMHSEQWSSEFRDALAAGYHRWRLEEYLQVVDLEAVNGRHARCCDSIHRLVNSDRMNSEMHLEGRIEWTQRCTGRLWSSEFGDALWGHDQARVEMQLETEIEWTQICTGRLWSSEFGHALAGYDRARLEEYLEAVDLEWGCRSWDDAVLDVCSTRC